MTISQWPYVLVEKHDSLNPFFIGKESVELIEEIVFLGPFCCAR